MQPLLFIDLETTGLSPAVNAPITVGALVLGGEHDGAVFQGKMRPWDGANINAVALQVNGYQFEEIMDWPRPADTFEEFRDFLCDTHPEPLQVHPVGHNVKFDESFLREWFITHTDAALYGSLFAPALCTIEVIKQTWPKHHSGAVWPKKGGLKLTFQYEWHFGTQYEGAHTELADCYATRALFLHADRESGRNAYAGYHHLIPKPPMKTPV